MSHTAELEPELLLTKAEATRLLRCSMRHLENLVNAQLMPRPVRIGKSPRFRKSDLLQWIAAGCPAVKPAG